MQQATLPGEPAREVRRIPLALIAPNPLQPRRSFDDTELRSLADSIASQGLVQPITIRPPQPGNLNDAAALTPGAEYIIVAGERRWRATKLIGWSEIDAIVRLDISATDAKVIALIENMQRINLSLIEECEGTAELLELVEQKLSLAPDPDGRSAMDIVAAQLGRSKAWVSKHIAYVNFPAEIKELAAEGMTDSLEILAALKRISELDSAEASGIIDNWRCGEPAPDRQELRELIDELESAARMAEEQERAKENASAQTRAPVSTPVPRSNGYLFSEPASDEKPAKPKESSYEREKRLREEKLALIEPELRRFAKDHRRAMLDAVVGRAGDLDKGFECSIGRDLYGRWGGDNGIPKSASAATYQISLKGSSDQAGLIVRALKPDLSIRLSALVTLDQLIAIEKIIGPKGLNEVFGVPASKLSKGAAFIREAGTTLSKPKGAPKKKADKKPVSPAKQKAGTGIPSSIDAFIKVNVGRNADSKLKAADLHAAYAAGRKDAVSLNSNEWGAAIAAAGIEKKRLNTGIHYIGVELLA